MRTAALFCFVLLFCFCGRGRADQRNSNCQWLTETSRQLNLKSAAARTHLRQDAQLAEDLAIRYADAHSGPHSGQFESWSGYNNARDRCMGSLFATVAADDGVTEEQVREAVARRPLAFDLTVMLSFAFSYFFVASAIARRVWQRFPLQDGRIAAVVATAAISIVVSAAGVFAGDIWAGIAENIRVGNGHLSYRLDRIPWRHHHLSLFIAGIALFWIAATIQSRRRRPKPTLTLLVPHSPVE